MYTQKEQNAELDTDGIVRSGVLESQFETGAFMGSYLGPCRNGHCLASGNLGKVAFVEIYKRFPQIEPNDKKFVQKLLQK